MTREELSTNRKAIEAELYRRVIDSLVQTRRPSLLAVNVSIVNRGVTLSGTVPGKFDRDFAVSTVRNVPGVREVTDQINIANP